MIKRLLQEKGFDELDRAILEELQANGRVSNADLARKIHLSQPAIYNRIRRLEKSGVIQKYTAILDREVVGYSQLCFIQIRLQGHAHEQVMAFREAIQNAPEVLECHHLTGDYDVLLKVVTASNKELERFLDETIRKLPNVERIQTNVVLREVKSTTELSLK